MVLKDMSYNNFIRGIKLQFASSVLTIVNNILSLLFSLSILFMLTDPTQGFIAMFGIMIVSFLINTASCIINSVSWFFMYKDEHRYFMKAFIVSLFPPAVFVFGVIINQLFNLNSSFVISNIYSVFFIAMYYFAISGINTVVKETDRPDIIRFGKILIVLQSISSVMPFIQAINFPDNLSIIKPLLIVSSLVISIIYCIYIRKLNILFIGNQPEIEEEETK